MSLVGFFANLWPKQLIASETMLSIHCCRTNFNSSDIQSFSSRALDKMSLFPTLFSVNFLGRSQSLVDSLRLTCSYSRLVDASLNQAITLSINQLPDVAVMAQRVAKLCQLVAAGS